MIHGKLLKDNVFTHLWQIPFLRFVWIVIEKVRKSFCYIGAVFGHDIKRTIMKTRLLAIAASVFCVVSLTGCNGVGPKESLLAKVNDESIYEEDMVLMLKDEKEKKTPDQVGQMLYERLYAGSALMSRALAEFPDLENEWKEMSKDLEIRWLTTIFRNSYVAECLTYSEAALHQFYNEHPQMFKLDSLMGFTGIRREVAGELYLTQNQTAYEGFLKKEFEMLKNPSAADSANAKQKFLQDVRHDLDKSIADSILVKYGFKVNDLPAIDARKYYEEHKDQYMTVPGYELYKIQDKDSLALVKKLPDNADLAAFKQAVVKPAKNKVVDPDSGYLGIVKQGFSLPYGIGVLPALDSILQGKSAGVVTPVLRGANNEFYRFYLASVVPSKQKPFDRVETSIIKAAENGDLLYIDSSAVLITRNGEPVFTEADLLKFNDRFVKRRMNKRGHNYLTNMLAEHFAYAEAAKAAKLDRDWEYRALVRSARIEFFTDHYLDRLSQNISDEEAKTWYNNVLAAENPEVDFETVKSQVKSMATFPVNLVKRDYYMGYRVMYAGKTFEQSFAAIQSRRVPEYRDLLKKRLMAEAYEKARIHLYKSDIPEYKPEVLAERALVVADSLHKAGNNDEALTQYRNLMFSYADVDSVFGKAIYAMAEIHNELAMYNDAEEEYYAYYRILPKYPNAEKAMFSRGFILNENLGLNPRALEVLEEFVKTYPTSDFKESADWLIENIKSNGKLQEELTKKIEGKS